MNLTTKSITVFLPYSTGEDTTPRDEMKNILQKAGIQIIPISEYSSNETELMVRSYFEVLGKELSTLPDAKEFR
ncbi:MAG: hypothetical protein HY958_10445 [Bacteroidia bacterium]|nr:hypothetical protein [Bacteroidia bacterium]